MKKLMYLGFCLVLAMGFGCALTNYELITDKDQNTGAGAVFTVNTSGKAHIHESIQIALIWPDGSADSTLWFVDQSNTGQTYSTYNNFTPSGSSYFHDDTYCNPDWVGCSILTGQHDFPLPTLFSAAGYTYKSYNPNCDGGRSVYYINQTSRYYGECGRARMPLADRIAFLNMGRIGQSNGVEGLFYDLNHNNLTITLNNNAGFSTTLPILGSASIFMTRSNAVIDMSHPLLSTSFRGLADFYANHATFGTTVTFTYNGISTDFHIGGVSDITNASRILTATNRRY